MLTNYILLARLFYGVLLTDHIHYQYFSLQGKEGFLLEGAELKTGDVLVRAVHPKNIFTDHPTLKRVLPQYNQTYYIPHEDFVWNKRNRILWPVEKCRSVLVGQRVHALLRRKQEMQDIDQQWLQHLSNKEFMHDLYYLFHKNRFRQHYITKYSRMGPQCLPGVRKALKIQRFYSFD